VPHEHSALFGIDETPWRMSTPQVCNVTIWPMRFDRDKFPRSNKTCIVVNRKQLLGVRSLSYNECTQQDQGQDQSARKSIACRYSGIPVETPASL